MKKRSLLLTTIFGLNLLFTMNSYAQENNYQPEKVPKVFLNEYNLSSEKYLTQSKFVSFSLYFNSKKDPGKTIKIISFDPKVIDVVIQYSPKSPKHFISLLEQPNIVAAINGVTVADFEPQGDIKGQDLDLANKQVNIYQLKKDVSAANERHSVGIKHDGTVDIVRGRIKLKNGISRSNLSIQNDKYKYFINGAALLMNNQNFTDEQAFLKAFAINNDKDLIKNMIPDAQSPRTVLGITKQGKVIIASFGEGKFGDGYGFSGFDVYKVLRSLNVNKAVMFDGGSASAMITKDSNGYVSHPKADYTVNASFITIFDL